MKSMKKTLYLVHGAVIAALYVVLTYLAAGFDLASGAIQVRFSEALTILPFFTPAAIPGLGIGCLLEVETVVKLLCCNLQHLVELCKEHVYTLLLVLLLAAFQRQFHDVDG